MRLEYFLANKPKLGKFHFLPKIHKILQNVPGRRIIKIFYRLYLYFFLFPFETVGTKREFYIEDTYDVLK